MQHQDQSTVEFSVQHNQLTKKLQNIDADFVGKCKSAQKLVEELSQMCIIDTKTSFALDEHQLSQMTQADHSHKWTQLDRDELIALAKVRQIYVPSIK